MAEELFKVCSGSTNFVRNLIKHCLSNKFNYIAYGSFLCWQSRLLQSYQTLLGVIHNVSLQPDRFKCWECQEHNTLSLICPYTDCYPSCCFSLFELLCRTLSFSCCSGRCAKQYCRRSGIVPLGIVLLLFRPVWYRSSYFELFLPTCVYVVSGIPGERIPQSISYVGSATSGLISPFILTLVVRLLM